MKTSLVVGLTLVVVFVGAVVVMAYRSAMEFRETQMWVTHTYKVLEELTDVLARIRDAESSTRGYIATGDASHLASFQAQREPILKSAEGLRALVKDNPAQMERCARLEPALAERVARFEELVRIRREEGAQAAAAGLTPGRFLSERVRGILLEMEHEERSLLGGRSVESDRSLSRTLIFLSTLSLAAIAILGALVFSARATETARRRAEDALRDLYDRAPCGYITADSRGILTRINATALSWLKYSREEVEGRLSADVILSPGPAGTFGQRLAAFREKGAPIDAQEFSFRRKDGSVFPVMVSALAEQDSGGTRLSVFDVTERKRIERELDQFFSTSLDLLAVADLSTGRLNRVSPSWTRTLGWTPEELTSQLWNDFIHPDDVPATNAEARKLEEGMSVVSFEHRFRCKDGHYRWLSWMVPAPLPGLRVAFAVGRDVTESRRLNAEIKSLNEGLKARVAETLAANKELESFSYSVSHDLRAPLRSIDGFSRILIEDHAAALGEEGCRLLNLVCASSRHMGQLIDDLLQYSRLGRKEIEHTRIEMGDLVRDAVEEVRKAQPDCSPAITIGPMPAARGDRTLLRQVWINLISNAFKYSSKSKEPRIEIGADGDDGARAYFVRDNGVGFDMRYAGKLFGVFQRLHAQTEFEGTGVGLAIVQRVIHRHGGRVWAEAKPGEGAVFHFSVPLQGEGS